MTLKQAAPAHAAPGCSMGMGAGWMLQMRGFAAGTAFFAITVSLPTPGSDRHHAQSQPHPPAPKTAAALKSPQAYSLLHGGMHRHQPQGAGNASAPCTHHSLDYCWGAGEWKRDPCPHAAMGDRGYVQQAQAQRGIRAMGQRLGLAGLPQLPPVMAWWKRVGGPDALPIAPVTSQASRDRFVPEPGAQRLWIPEDRDSWAPGLCSATVQMHLPTFLGAACMPAEVLGGVGQGCSRAQHPGARELMHTSFPSSWGQKPPPPSSCRPPPALTATSYGDQSPKFGVGGGGGCPPPAPP